MKRDSTHRRPIPPEDALERYDWGLSGGETLIVFRKATPSSSLLNYDDTSERRMPLTTDCACC